MRPARIATCCLAVLLIAVTAPPAVPQSTFNQKEISVDLALTIAQSAMEKCRADGYRITISIIDSNNILKAFVRDDGSNIISSDLSRQKAYTALVFGRTSGEQGTIWRSSTPPATPLPGTVGGAGGVPIKIGDEVIGAIGISGAPNGDKDEACATAALAKIAERLK
jgi:uncharacterized protein GlcG (DUF336 family)